MNGGGLQSQLIGREYLIQAICQSLFDGDRCGVLVVGDAGMGKTALAKAVLETIDSTRTVVKVSAAPSLQAVPFGALAPYLRGLSTDDATSPVAIYRAILAHLSNGSTVPDEAPLFVVDDAHELDDSTAVLLSQLVASDRIKVLLLARSRPGPHPEFLSLWRDSLLHRHQLTPLDPAEGKILCEAVLGGEALTSLHSLLYARSRGNPMFLLALLEFGVRGGYITAHRGIWRVSGPQPLGDMELADLILNQLGRLDAEETEAMELVALAEPVPVQTVIEALGGSAVYRLLERELVEITTDLARTVTLSHPLFGEVIRSRVPVGRSIRLRRRILDAHSFDESEAIEGYLRRVAWALDCGSLPADEVLLRAAIIANRVYDSRFALRAARAVDNPLLRGRALIEISRAEMMHGKFDYARSILDEVLEECNDLAVAREGITLSIALRLRRGHALAGIRADVEQWRAIIARAEAAGAPEAAVATALLGSRVSMCVAELIAGNYAEAETELTEVLADSHVSEESTVVGLSLLAAVHDSTGRAVSGAALAQKAVDLVNGSGHRHHGYRDNVMVRFSVSMVNAGKYRELASVFREYASAHPASMVYVGGLVEYCDGMAAMRSGRARTAHKRLLAAVEGFGEWDPAQLRYLSIGMAAHAAMRLGDTESTQLLLQEFDAAEPLGTKATRLRARIHAAVARLPLDGESTVQGKLLALADDAAQRGFTSVELSALEELFRSGERNVLARLARVAAGQQGTHAQLIREAASAELVGDARKLVAVAELARDESYFLASAEAYCTAIRLYEKQLQLPQARALQGALRRAVEELEGMELPCGMRPGGGAESTLTARERDIVALAAKGFSNREIAHQQSVSVRTVEGHLYRIFAKLGITSRSDLANY